MEYCFFISFWNLFLYFILETESKHLYNDRYNNITKLIVILSKGFRMQLSFYVCNIRYVTDLLNVSVFLKFPIFRKFSFFFRKFFSQNFSKIVTVIIKVSCTAFENLVLYVRYF